MDQGDDFPNPREMMDQEGGFFDEFEKIQRANSIGVIVGTILGILVGIATWQYLQPEGVLISLAGGVVLLAITWFIGYSLVSSVVYMWT